MPSIPGSVRNRYSAAMRYNNRPVVSGEYGESEDWENGLELMVSGPLTDDVFMDFNTVYWARMDSEEEISALLNRIQLDYYNDKIGEVFFEAYNMGKDFAPRFFKRESEVEDYLDRVGSGVKAKVTVSDSLVDVVDLTVGTDL